ncbi:hypothetical protein P5673_028305, partial [Acropora cervicornis]
MILRQHCNQVGNSFNSRQHGDGHAQTLNIARCRKLASSVRWLHMGIVVCFVPMIILATLTFIPGNFAWREFLNSLNETVEPTTSARITQSTLQKQASHRKLHFPVTFSKCWNSSDCHPKECCAGVSHKIRGACVRQPQLKERCNPFLRVSWS